MCVTWSVFSKCWRPKGRPSGSFSAACGGSPEHCFVDAGGPLGRPADWTQRPRKLEEDGKLR